MLPKKKGKAKQTISDDGDSGDDTSVAVSVEVASGVTVDELKKILDQVLSDRLSTF